MRTELRGFDTYGAPYLHAVQLGDDDWIYTYRDCSGLFSLNRQGLITALADVIMDNRPVAENYVVRLGVGNSSLAYKEITIDRAGNTWLDDKYLHIHEYLPLLIPQTASP